MCAASARAFRLRRLGQSHFDINFDFFRADRDRPCCGIGNSYQHSRRNQLPDHVHCQLSLWDERYAERNSGHQLFIFRMDRRLLGHNDMQRDPDCR